MVRKFPDDDPLVKKLVPCEKVKTFFKPTLSEEGSNTRPLEEVLVWGAKVDDGTLRP